MENRDRKNQLNIFNLKKDECESLFKEFPQIFNEFAM